VSKSEHLKINEIFYSVQGESTRIGLPTIFIRLTGCPMRCVYCDTAYAFHDGRNYTFEQIFEEIKQYDTKFVTVTGGEPLAQKPCFDFINQLSDMGYQVSIETGGAVSIENIDPRAKIILDIKTPGSGEIKNYDWNNLAFIKPDDEIKIVITNQDDYEWAKTIILKENLANKAEILLSPVYGQVNPEDLASWILKDRLRVRLQLQLHKVIWGDKKGV
jgi:7-carboxy-7-deazaguanine synthase|tara:strand:+ start:1430 stop:2080 length:651 start_codon:yes stop_codon:yes gene_type:complete